MLWAGPLDTPPLQQIRIISVIKRAAISFFFFENGPPIIGMCNKLLIRSLLPGSSPPPRMNLVRRYFILGLTRIPAKSVCRRMKFSLYRIKMKIDDVQVSLNESTK